MILSFLFLTCFFFTEKVVSDWVGGGTMKDNVIAQYGSIDDWDISAVTNLRFVFQDKSTFNADLSKWNTWSVEKMSFGKCVIFPPLFII